MRPAGTCTIRASCDILVSEDPDIVAHALETVLDSTKARCGKSSAEATAGSSAALGKIREVVHSRASTRAWRKRLRTNADEDSTWVYLNKQAAASGVIALCEEADESPLGPITLSIKADNIEAIIDWFAPRAESKAQEN